MRLHHIGYITGNINKTANAFEQLGYCKQQIFDDAIQRCYICFLYREEDTLIELVQPYAENKSMQKILAKKGVSPYHLCYEVEDVQDIYDKLSEKEGWLAIFSPVEAVALCNRKITYFMNPEIGYIEFVNK